METKISDKDTNDIFANSEFKITKRGSDVATEAPKYIRKSYFNRGYGGRIFTRVNVTTQRLSLSHPP